MASSSFYIEGTGSAVDIVQNYLRRYKSGEIVCVGVGQEVIGCGLDFPSWCAGGCRLRHGVIPPRGYFSRERSKPDPSDPMFERPVMKQMVSIAIEWLVSGGKGKRDAINDTDAKLFTVCCAEENPKTFKLLEMLMDAGVPISSNEKPPCFFEVITEDGKLVDIFQLSSVVEGGKTVRVVATKK